MSVVVFKCVLRRPNVRDGLVVLTTECLQPSADESTRWPAEMRAGAANHGKRHSKATCTSAYTPRVSLRLRTRRARPRPCPATVVVGAGKTAVCRRRCSIGCSSARQLLGSRADPSPPPSPSTSKVGVNCIREQSFRDPQCSYKWEERCRSISKSCVRLCSQPHGSYIFRVLPSRSQSPTARGQTRRQFKLV